MLMKARVCYLRFNLQVATCNDGDLTDLSVHQVSTPPHIKISEVIYCARLLLCVVKYNSRLLLWNPYLGQTRWIRSLKTFKPSKDTYALGYDNENRNVKVLRYFEDLTTNAGQRFELYDFNSNSWKVLKDKASPKWDIWAPQLGSVSVKGNTYFFVQEYRDDEEVEANTQIQHLLYCYDYTKEKFIRTPLSLPFKGYCHEEEIIDLSSVREEKLALIYNRLSTTNTLEIWITAEIEPNAATWSMFLKVDITLFSTIPDNFFPRSFFIDEKKNVAVIFGGNGYYRTGCYSTANVGEDGSIESVNVGEAEDKYCRPLVCSSYAPSLVEVRINKPCTAGEASSSRA